MDAIMGSGTDTETTSAATDRSAAGANAAAAGPIQWHPISLIRGSRPPTPEGDDGSDDVRKPGFALIVLNQPITHHLGIIRRVWKNAFTRIAADGGANCLYGAAGVRGDDSFVSSSSAAQLPTNSCLLPCRITSTPSLAILTA
jgi:hypothetical protein